MSPYKTLKKRVYSTLALSLATILPLASCGTSADEQADNTSTGSTISASSRVSVHDPSVIKDEKSGTYYIFGSHRAWAKSDDLETWTTFTNNLSTDFSKILGEAWDSWPKQDATPTVDGNMWAPDVIYNKATGKYCMYMSLNGADYKSMIVLLTADSLDGDWSYVGPVVYSGFDTSTAKDSDVYKVLGEGADLTRYQSTSDTKINAIDPAVTYDEEGNLWMSFGSWFGGIWMFKLDPATGLRDYTQTYETTEDASDPYYGTKLAGGRGVSGEGSYLVNSNGYWYLFLSYGELAQKGGYQIRVFRSDKITGPYVDENGNAAIATRTIANNWEGTTGIRLLSSYSWSGGPESIETAQGHNSVLSDDGKLFLVYHTRFVDKGEEHQVRVRQLMSTSNDWLVTAPYEYQGTDASTSGYDASKIAGDYELITHVPTTYFKGIKKSQKSKEFRGINTPQSITLSDDGKITGDVTGTWTAEKETSTITLVLDDVTYEGVLSVLPNEASGKEVMTFSALGDNITIWGSQK